MGSSLSLNRPNADVSQDKLDFTFDEEPLVLPKNEGYGYFPISIGQTPLAGRYSILRKLGWGMGSTVWLSRDTLESQFVAIKILTAVQSENNFKGAFGELSILQKISTARPTHPGSHHVTCLKGHFVLDGAETQHQAFVTEVLGSTLRNMRRQQPGGTFSIPTTKRVTKQILQALDYLHTECGVIHTDLKSDNIMVALDFADEEIESLLIDDPWLMYPPRSSSFLPKEPIVTIKSQPLPNFGVKEDGSNLHVKVGDLGHATWKEKHFHEEIQPIGLRAPEVVLGYPWSTPVDIWTVGCLVVEMLTGRDMWNPKPGSTWSADDDHLAKMLRVTKETFPDEMISNSKRGLQYFDPDHPGKLRAFSVLGPLSMIEYLQKWNKADEAELEKAWAFVKKCYTLDPAERPSAAELLKDEWLQDVE